ncbi:PepSY domain-containing protein [Ramlibacter sp. G-1-2-2]|uniref:PepSY domain-containing protein n=1 Tax=Ramlibacter agri TaxID=2728837 RepID=A0A848HBS0_9BURK|nr:PepSY-associated TM helix domain-containing protein [Ramlibacter agri]NML48476.1 PepSY domain-containing protein [Ramlibacter agri]
MSARAVRGWSWVHKWSSLVCTLFMLLLCLTGLPLIFHEEIGDLTGAVARPPAMPAGTPHISLDRALEIAHGVHPDRVVQFASQDESHTDAWYITMTPTPAPTADFVQVVVDSRTGAVLPQPPIGKGFMAVIESLHVDLFAGQPGKLFLGAMGVLLLAAIVSGLVLYAPFMRKLDFGQVRTDRSPRVRWLDLHNLLGIATLVWALVVGATGVINTWAELLLDHWQKEELAALLQPYEGQPLVPAAERASLQRSLETALAAAPGMKVAFIAFPGTSFSSPHHNTFYLRGSDPLTARLNHTVMVDARTAQLTAIPATPWYLLALRLSQPLHFGDYGGMPMKILWALLDVATLVVLGSGLYLWWKRA